MQTSVNEALQWLDGTKEQLHSTEKRVKAMMPEAPDELKKTLTDHLQQVESLSNTLSRPSDMPTYMLGPQLVERLGNLFGRIDRTNAAPTIYQQEYFKELQAEFAEKMTVFNNFVEGVVPKLNETLAKHKVPTIMSGKTVILAASPAKDSE
jgi:hypothetical protein